MTISLLGREFRVAVPEGEHKQLQASVGLPQPQDEGSARQPARSWQRAHRIMAALNIAHEFVSNPGKGAAAAPGDNGAIKRRILAMQETLDSALAADQDNLF
jgi:cell division protein ZapA (FtsZ GTPase activity inhibitor)